MPVQALNEIVGAYFHLFVNRRAYTVQAARPDPETGRHYYYRPTAKGTGQPLGLTYETLRRHLEGQITIALYAINPSTQRCKWIAIDADYKDALEDLLKLNYYLGRDGVCCAGEKPAGRSFVGLLRIATVGAVLPGLRLRPGASARGSGQGKWPTRGN